MAAEKGTTSKAAQDLEIKLNKENETLGKMPPSWGTPKKRSIEMGNESDDTAKEEDQATKIDE